MEKAPTRAFSWLKGCAFNQEKALVGAFFVITNHHVDIRFKLYCVDMKYRY